MIQVAAADQETIAEVIYTDNFFFIKFVVKQFERMHFKENHMLYVIESSDSGQHRMYFS